MKTVSFTQNTIKVLIATSREYKTHFIDKEYLIFSSKLSEAPYHILTGKAENYLHLTGVDTALSKIQFYRKCVQGKIGEQDIQCGTSGSLRRSFIRDKRAVLPEMKKILTFPNLFIEESFSRNRIYSKLATTNLKSTLGFVEGDKGKLIPNTLLKGQKLSSASLPVELVLSMPKNSDKFTTIEQGSLQSIRQMSQIIPLLSDDLLQHL